MAAACPPMMAALATSALLARLAASTPSSMPASASIAGAAASCDAAARDVALRDVRQLVRQHRGQLVAAWR
jgi:hypothetical protein